jgi:hypothetical protein
MKTRILTLLFDLCLPEFTGDHFHTSISNNQMSNNLQSLHDFPQVHIDRGDQVVEYTFLNIKSTSSAAEKSIQLSQDTLTSVYDWFSSCLNRPANGSEIYAVAKQLYVSGRYAQATACILLFRGHLENMQIHGGGVDDIHVIHLLGHLNWKLGYHSQSFFCLQEVYQRRNQNTLATSVKGLKKGTPVGSTSFENSWQLLVEMGLDVYEGGERKANKQNETTNDSRLEKEFQKRMNEQNDGIL